MSLKKIPTKQNCLKLKPTPKFGFEKLIQRLRYVVFGMIISVVKIGRSFKLKFTIK